MSSSSYSYRDAAALPQNIQSDKNSNVHTPVHTLNPKTFGGTTPYVNIDVQESSVTPIKAAPGLLYGGLLYNNGTSVNAAAWQGGTLNDLTAGGAYTDSAANPLAVFEVYIVATGTPDTWKWRKNGGAWSATTNITAGALALSDGVTVTFAATTGHGVADDWHISVGGTLYVKFYDKATAPTSSDTPKLVYPVAPGQSARVAGGHFGAGFATGIAIRACRGIANNNAVAPAANGMVASLEFA